MLDQAIRFGGILDQPEFQRGGAILEVGSGTRGITAFTTERVIGVDVAFTGVPERGMTAIRASATALPLRDRSFDRVVSSDMLEHLAPQDRAAAIRELLRVTRGNLFLACPCDSAAQRLDTLLGRLIRRLRVRLPDWLAEHLQQGIPESAAITQVLQGLSATWREVKVEMIGVHGVVTFLISMKLLNRLWTCWFYGNPGRATRVYRALRGWGKTPYRKLWVVKAL